jgi:hypothetical protein
MMFDQVMNNMPFDFVSSVVMRKMDHSLHCSSVRQLQLSVAIVLGTITANLSESIPRYDAEQL